eukprot:scpid96064/ scgid26218/ 
MRIEFSTGCSLCNMLISASTVEHDDGCETVLPVVRQLLHKILCRRARTSCVAHTAKGSCVSMLLGSEILKQAIESVASAAMYQHHNYMEAFALQCLLNE